MWSPANDMKENKMGITWHALIKSILDILLESRTQKYHSAFLRKRMGEGGGGGGWEVSPTTFLELPQNWVICIEKVVPNNFA